MHYCKYWRKEEKCIPEAQENSRSKVANHLWGFNSMGTAICSIKWLKSIKICTIRMQSVELRMNCSLSKDKE